MSVKNMSWHTTAETIPLRWLTKGQDVEISTENLLMNLFMYHNDLGIQ